jgi:DEAD/DEAH box helicase domain-containing protein
MRKFPVVFDLETKYTFREYNDPKKLGVSVAAIYDFKDEKGQVFVESEISKLYPIIEGSSYIIGFNIKSFDMQVLQRYYPGKVDHFAVFDIMDDIRDKIGRRLALNDLISATLGKKKSGHGLMAIDYYKEKKWDELKRYCLDDVMLTKELFQYGVDNGEIFYMSSRGKVSLKVDWKKYLNGNGEKKDMPLTLPF